MGKAGALRPLTACRAPGRGPRRRTAVWIGFPLIPQFRRHAALQLAVPHQIAQKGQHRGKHGDSLFREQPLADQGVPPVLVDGEKGREKIEDIAVLQHILHIFTGNIRKRGVDGAVVIYLSVGKGVAALPHDILNGDLPGCVKKHGFPDSGGKMVMERPRIQIHNLFPRRIRQIEDRPSFLGRFRQNAPHQERQHGQKQRSHSPHTKSLLKHRTCEKRTHPFFFSIAGGHGKDT